jgi:hypothetical protein
MSIIKYYTSGITASKSITKIEELLAKHGAKDIIKQYDDGYLTCIFFSIQLNDGTKLAFKLPARVEKVKDVLLKASKRPRDGTIQKIREQAEKTAWKLVSDWVEIQLTLVDLDQAEIVEVFLPHVYDASKNQTLFDKMKVTNYKLLTAGD